LNFEGASKTKPQTAPLPPINPAGLGLCKPNGDLDPARTVELFRVVAAYWEHKDKMGMELGYVAAMWKRTNSADTVIKFIKDNTQRDHKTGKPELVFPEASPDEKLFGALLPLDIPFAEVTTETVEKLRDWISAVPFKHSSHRDQRQKLADIVFLGLTDFSGIQDPTAMNFAREYIWQHIDQPPNFKALWRHIQASKGAYPAHDPNADFSAYNERIAELYDQGASNLAISENVTELAKSGVPVPTDHLAFAAWILWQMGRSGEYGFQLEGIFNKHKANWLASDAANEFLYEVFPDESANPLVQSSKTGRNNLCPCGSGKKYKKCCGR
jgi:hypothetical protein